MRDGNWWLGVIQSATHPATQDGPHRAHWARFVAAALATARATGELDEREVLVRQANLCLVLARDGRLEEIADTLRPDDAARDCLAYAASISDDPPATDKIEAMRRLRRIRNVMAPAVALVDHVTDDDLRDQLAGWTNVLPGLP
ncbi:hypothetical protein EV193_10567 [Herbihabitans rhizosphaerae]|uniref:Uncharacterized protein n=1 Tax=Herbihabitans rhizosphaerae TaxID=1872711 RepID=A0A4Q7KQC9_9PSEU|nr:hypothetical protein [Herbihabitans rhizosphaerae]RZS37512.1 hypothetical protein EV193_10567 [Herbihabitans rhizosphaerae]